MQILVFCAPRTASCNTNAWQLHRTPLSMRPKMPGRAKQRDPSMPSNVEPRCLATQQADAMNDID
jgi:hypothetical protein